MVEVVQHLKSPSATFAALCVFFSRAFHESDAEFVEVGQLAETDIEVPGKPGYKRLLQFHERTVADNGCADFA